jgi:mono/diheme cytochrome c family protein
MSLRPLRYLLLTTVAALSAVAVAGCGNQMYRQPSYQALDAPRAEPPASSVPAALSLVPTDARPLVSPAWGDNTIALAVDPLTQAAPEPILPPPNLSDNARNEPAPASVDALQSPFPLDNAHLISGGHILFLNRCVQCHNASGTGYGTVGAYLLPHPPDLASNLVQHISDGAMFWHITVGQGKMPGFRHWTSPTERWALVSYVRSLKYAPADNSEAGDVGLAPYPVYGQVGFERNRSVSAYKVIPGSTYATPTEGSLKLHADKGVTTEPLASGSYGN